MKLKITTTYENFDKEWLDWYMKRLANEQVLPGSTSIVEQLQKDGAASFSSKDPEGPCIATTAYELIR